MKQRRGYFKPQTIFLFAFAVTFSLLFVVFLIKYIINLRHTVKAKGTIKKIDYAINKEMRKNNSKWANIGYIVNDKFIVSINQIQVPLSAEIDDKIFIRYYKHAPEKISLIKSSALVFLGISTIIFAFAAYLTQFII